MGFAMVVWFIEIADPVHYKRYADGKSYKNHVADRCLVFFSHHSLADLQQTSASFAVSALRNIFNAEAAKDAEERPNLLLTTNDLQFTASYGNSDCGAEDRKGR